MSNVDKGWKDFAEQTDKAWDQYFSQENAGEKEVILPDTRTSKENTDGYERAGSEEWSEDDLGIDFSSEDDDIEDVALSDEDEGYSESADSEQQEEVDEYEDEDDVAIEDESQGEEESSTESESELPSTEVIKVDGLQTTLDYDMNNDRNRQKYKKAVQMAAGYKKLHANESVLRNELKDIDTSYLKAENIYSKEGMQKVAGVVKAMGTLQSFVDSGDLEGLFKTLTRSESHPDGVDIHDYAKGVEQNKVDLANMSESERQAYDDRQELKEMKKQLAKYQNQRDVEAQQVSKTKEEALAKERENQVVPVFKNLRIRADDVGGSSTRAFKQNKTLWNETKEFCKKFEAETGSLPDQATLEKFIKEEKQDLIGYQKQARATAKVKKVKKQRAKASQEAAAAVKGKSGLKSTNVGDIENYLLNAFNNQ